ncbi:MAG: NHL repeat-containing protein [Clostridia bacterium]|nr:NHL repeat-containing protein [Clostridia bacterium]
MKVMHRLLALIMTVFMLASMTTALAVDDAYPSTYTYNYDYWSDIRESPDAYRVEKVIYSKDLGLDVAMKKPQSLFVRNNDIYVADTGNNRILQIRRNGSSYELFRVIDQIQGTEVTTFNTPTDVFVDVNENIYIADTNNGRVVMVDKDLNFIQQLTKPTDATFDQSLSFLPAKIVVDVSGRVFVLATNVNKGLAKFEADGSFTGFIGANKVSYNFAEYIWKNYFMTKAQREQQASFVPTEYRNIYIDPESFIYATNVSFSEYDLLWDVAQPIRRLNGIGNDILIKNDRYPPIGDLYWLEGSVLKGPSKLVDITVLENDIYVVIDQTRGRIFGYDSQGVMLWAFGTSGSREGAFNSAISIEHMGNDLFVLDQNGGAITAFTPTEYGQMIYDATDSYLKGDYDGSALLWEEVLTHNANYNLAFIGIGRSLMRQEKYEEAMDYFKMANDRENYGRAFRFYRKEMVEANILWIVVVLALVLIVPIALGKVKKMRMEVETHERNKVQH